MGGGGYLNEFFASDTLARLFELAVAHLLSKPFIIYAQTIGPFFSARLILITKLILQQASLITLRDNTSAHLLNDMGVRKPQIKVTADEALLTSPVNQYHTSIIMKRENVRTELPIIGIAPRYWSRSKLENSTLHRLRKDNIYKNYIGVIAAVSDRLIEQLRCQIVMIPFQTYKQSTSKDDRCIAKDIISMMRHPHNAVIIQGEYSPNEIMGLIESACEMIIGTRFHSLVFAACSFRPLVGISYWFKIDEFMRELELSDYVCDIDDLEANFILDKAIQAWTYREEISSKLKNKVIELRSRALLNATYVANFARSLV